MIEHVWRRTQATPGITAAFIATDDSRIAEAAQQFQAPCVRTGKCSSGGDRVAQAAQILQQQYGEPQWVLNVQGDEPAIHPQDLATLLQGMKTPSSQQQLPQLGTLIYPIANEETWRSPHVVKVVLNQHQQALYFSRSPIPHGAFNPQHPPWRHLGVYCFRYSCLETFHQLPSTFLSQQESLEQLRALEHQIPISCFQAQHFSPGVDTPQDVALAEAALRRHPLP